MTFEFTKLDHLFRKDYDKDMLLEEMMEESPFDQFKKWFQDVVDSGVRQPNAMTLSTVSADGQPSSRIVLLKQFDDSGFVFFTNYNSDKGQDMATNPKVSLLFFSMPGERQMRVQGTIEKVSYDMSNKYFKSRPIDSQIAALVSDQSTVVENREQLEQSFLEMQETYKESGPECPETWGGYRVIPNRFEFWQGRVNRLHDRLVYFLENGRWNLRRLAP